MKKIFLTTIIAFLFASLYGSEAKNNANTYNFSNLDSIKETIEINNNSIKLNVNKFSNEPHLYNSFSKTFFGNGTVYETKIYSIGENETYLLIIIFYNDGNKFIRIKNINNGREFKTIVRT